MNYFAVGFVAVLGVAGLAVDYQNQTAKAGLALGQLGPGDYVATINARIEGAKAEKLANLAESQRKQAWKQGGKPYLPDAPEGWARRGFDEGDNSAIIPAERRMQGPDTHAAANYLANTRFAADGGGQSSAAGAGIANMMAKRKGADLAGEVAKRSFVYERGDETVFVEITQRNAPNLNSLAGNIAATINAQFASIGGQDAGWGVIGGVAFIEALDSDGTPSNHYRILRGTIGFGQEVEIRVHANASRAATREILAAIDYDGLNAMLKTPMAAVGNGLTPPDGVDERKLAEAMFDLRGEFDGLLAQEAQYRVANLDAGALMINTLAQGYGAGEGGITDLTGGKAVSMEALIRAGFRSGMRDLMEGRDGRQALGEINTMFGAAVSQSDAQLAATSADQPAPAPATMSPALAAELGVVTAPATPPVSPARQAQARAEAAVAQAQAAAQTDQPTAAPAQGGGFMGALAGLFGGGGGGGTAKQSRERVEIRQLGGGGTRLASGGCGAGKFCPASE